MTRMPHAASATAKPYGLLNAGCWSVWCRACPWRTEPTPAAPDLESFRAVRAASEAAWRDHQEKAHGSEGRRQAGWR